MTAVVVHGNRAPMTAVVVHGNRALRNPLRCTVFCAPNAACKLHGFRAPKVHGRGCNIGIPTYLGILHPVMHWRARPLGYPCRISVRGYANRGLPGDPQTACAWNEVSAL